MEISGIPRLETLGIEPGTITKGSVVTWTGTNIYRYNSLQDQLRGIWLKKNLHRNKYMYNPSCLTKPPPPSIS